MILGQIIDLLSKLGVALPGKRKLFAGGHDVQTGLHTLGDLGEDAFEMRSRGEHNRICFGS